MTLTYQPETGRAEAVIIPYDNSPGRDEDIDPLWPFELGAEGRTLKAEAERLARMLYYDNNPELNVLADELFEKHDPNIFSFNDSLAPWINRKHFDLPSGARAEVLATTGIIGLTTTDIVDLYPSHHEEIISNGRIDESIETPYPVFMNREQYLIQPIVPGSSPVGQLGMHVLVRYGDELHIAKRSQLFAIPGAENTLRPSVAYVWQFIDNGQYLVDADDIGFYTTERGVIKVETLGTAPELVWAGKTAELSAYEGHVRKLCRGSDLSRYLEDKWKELYEPPDAFRQDDIEGLTEVQLAAETEDFNRNIWYIDRFPLPEEPQTVKRSTKNTIKRQRVENQFADPYEEEPNTTTLTLTGYLYPRDIIAALDNMARDPESKVIRVFIPKKDRVFNQLEYRVQGFDLTADKPVFVNKVLPYDTSGIPYEGPAWKYQMVLMAMPARGEFSNGAESAQEQVEGGVGQSSIVEVAKSWGMKPNHFQPYLNDDEGEDYTKNSEYKQVNWFQAIRDIFESPFI